MFNTNSAVQEVPAAPPLPAFPFESLNDDDGDDDDEKEDQDDDAETDDDDE